jgi:MFS family permease
VFVTTLVGRPVGVPRVLDDRDLGVLAADQGANSAYAVWGWRIPFVIGSLLAVALAVYYARQVSESKVWETAAKKRSP